MGVYWASSARFTTISDLFYLALLAFKTANFIELIKMVHGEINVLTFHLNM